MFEFLLFGGLGIRIIHDLRSLELVVLVLWLVELKTLLLY